MVPRWYGPPSLADADAGSSAVASRKHALRVDPEFASDRHLDRVGNRDLDDAVAHAGLGTAAEDEQRAFPRDVTTDPSRRVMVRQLPQQDSVRSLISSRQRKARSRSKMTALDEMTTRQYTTLDDTMRDPARWEALNDALSAVVGNAQELSDDDAVAARRLDGAIHAYERRSEGRGHLVYCNVKLPTHINHQNVDGYITHQYEPGSLVEFDRYTGSTHCLHELEPTQSSTTDVAFEIATDRGIYLGASDSSWRTPHLLPRGIALYSHGAHRAQYQRPDGTIGERLIVQLSHDPPEGAPVITAQDRADREHKRQARRQRWLNRHATDTQTKDE